MDSQIWFYIILGLIVFLSRVLKKKEPEPVAEERKPDRHREVSRTQPSSDKPKPLTFEELLREITEAKQAPEPAYQKPQPEYVDYDDQIGEEEQNLETIESDNRKKDSIYEVYEDAKRQAFARASLEETMKLRDTNIEFGKFKGFEQEKKRNLLEEYTRDFRDPEGLKKAVVISEILNRKF